MDDYKALAVCVGNGQWVQEYTTPLKKGVIVFSSIIYYFLHYSNFYMQNILKWISTFMYPKFRWRCCTFWFNHAIFTVYTVCWRCSTFSFTCAPECFCLLCVVRLSPRTARKSQISHGCFLKKNKGVRQNLRLTFLKRENWLQFY